MNYLTYILIVATISIGGLWIVAQYLNKKIWVLDRGFLGTLVIFYLLWWVGDFLAIKFGYYTYNPELTLNIYFGGIPLEDHIAGPLIPIWIRGLYDLFERGSTRTSWGTKDKNKFHNS